MGSKKQDWIAKYFSILVIIILLCIMFVGAFSAKIEKENRVHLLSIEQQQNIVYQVGISGYKNLIKNGCSNEIAKKIATGEWSDNWCQSHYSHLELK